MQSQTQLSIWIFFGIIVLVVAVYVIGGYIVNMQKRTRIFLRIIVLIVLVVAVYVIGGYTTLSYLEDKYDEIPMKASQAQVRNVLHHFREVKVTPIDVPEGFRENYSKSVPSYRIYRYDFLGLPALAIHVVYDKQGHAVRKIPTYE